MSNSELASELAKLCELRDSGAITDEEFAAAKAKLISGDYDEADDGEVRLPTASQVVRLGVGVAWRTFLITYFLLPLGGFVFLLILMGILKLAGVLP